MGFLETILTRVRHDPQQYHLLLGVGVVVAAAPRTRTPATRSQGPGGQQCTLSWCECCVIRSTIHHLHTHALTSTDKISLWSFLDIFAYFPLTTFTVTTLCYWLSEETPRQEILFVLCNLPIYYSVSTLFCLNCWNYIIVFKPTLNNIFPSTTSQEMQPSRNFS